MKYRLIKRILGIAKAYQIPLFEGLIPEKRVVRRKGRTHVQTYYVRPDRSTSQAVQPRLFEPEPATAPKKTEKPTSERRGRKKPSPTDLPPLFELMELIPSTLERLEAAGHASSPEYKRLKEVHEKLTTLFDFDFSAQKPKKEEAKPTEEKPAPLPRLAPEAAKPAEHAIAELLDQLGLAQRIREPGLFHLRLAREPYPPLVLEAHDEPDGRRLYVSQYAHEEEGHRLEHELVFRITSDGLRLEETATHGPMGEEREGRGKGEPDRAMADHLARTLLEQGYGRIPPEEWEGQSAPLKPADLEERRPKVGDIKIVNGRKYRLNENHRWERVRDEVAQAQKEEGQASEKPARRKRRAKETEPTTEAQAASGESPPEATGERSEEPQTASQTESEELPDIVVGLPDETTAAQRRRWNEEAVRIVEDILKTGRKAVPEEKTILARYSGNGGIGNSLNEYYTPPELAKSMWGVLRKAVANLKGPVLPPAPSAEESLKALQNTFAARILKAKYTGICLLSGKTINVGDEIIWSPDGFVLSPSELKRERRDLVELGAEAIVGDENTTVALLDTSGSRLIAREVKPKIEDGKRVWDSRSLMEDVYIIRTPEGWQCFGWLERGGGRVAALLSLKDALRLSKSRVSAMLEALEAMEREQNGPQVLGLEPSAGTGVLLQDAPRNAKIDAVELSPISATIARELFGNRHQVHNMPFEDFSKQNPDKLYDFVIANPPFGPRGEGALIDEPDIPEAARYFAYKTLQHLKPGGVAVMILPAGIARNPTNADFRRRILAHAEVLAIHGLPTKTFERAGTQVATTDVWVLRRRDPDLAKALEAGGDPALEALGILDRAFIDGKWHEVHPEQLHGAETQRPGVAGRPAYAREGELTPEILSAIVERTPLPETPQYTVQNLIEALEAKGDLNTLAKVNAALVEKEGPREGAVRYGKHGLQVLRNGRWHNVEEPVQQAYVHGKQLSALLASFHQALNSNNVDAANQMRPQIEKLLKEYLETHGNPHTNEELKRLIKDDPEFARLLAAILPDGSIAEIYLKDAQKGATDYDPTDFDQVLHALRRSGQRISVTGLLALYRGPDANPLGIARALISRGYALRPNGTWTPSEEYYVGDAKRIKEEIEEQLKEVNRRLEEGESGVELTIRKEALEAQLKGLEARLPRRLLEDIDVTPTSPFVPVHIVKEYLVDMAQNMGHRVYGHSFELKRGENGTFVIRPSRYSYHKLPSKLENFFKRYLNGIGRRSDEEDLYKELDENFADWLAARPEYREAVEESYNSTFNAWLEPQYDSSPIHHEIPGWNPEIVPHWWQNEDVRRSLAQGGGITALDVGLGKTLTAILRVLYAKKMGLARRPMIAVPKSVLANWRQEFLKAKPDAKLLIVGAEPVLDKNGKPVLDENGQPVWREVTDAATLSRQLARVNSEDWDAVLITHPTLVRIPISPARLLQMLEDEFKSQEGGDYFDRPEGMSSSMWDLYVRLKAEQLLKDGVLTLDDLQNAQARLERVEAELKALTGKKLSNEKKLEKAAKQRERRRLWFIARAARLLGSEGRGNDLGITWEELGIDHLEVDEAHAYKALWEPPARLNVRYLGAGQASQQATDLYYKTRELRERTGGRGVYLMTATPIKNSPIELYNMTSYIHPEFWKELGIHTIEQFINRYADIEPQIVINNKGQPQTQDALVGLKNLRELRSVASRIINRKAAREVGLKLPTPKTEYRLIQPEEAQRQFIREILEKPLESIRRYMGVKEIPEGIESYKLDPRKKDVYDKLFDRYRLVLSHLLRRAGTDLEMLDPERYRGYVSPKVKELLKDVKDALSRGEKVVIFSDLKDMPDPAATKANPNGYSFHEKLRKLIAEAAQIPADQIAIVNADETPDSEDRQQISEGLRTGKYRVVIGNTATMGQGLNLQHEVQNLFHLDVPWNPADLQQREGRVIRQGNKSEEVRNRFYMGTRGLDAFMLDTLRGKANWYDEFWNGEGDSIEASTRDVIPSRDVLIALSIEDDEEREKALQEVKKREEEAKRLLARKQALDRFKKYQTAYKALQEHRAKFPEGKPMPERSQAVRKALEAKVADLRKRLEADEAFAPYREFLDKPHAILFDPTTGREYVVGRRYVMQKGNYVYAVEATGLDPVKKTVVLRNLDKDNEAELEFSLKKLSEASFEPYSRRAHARLAVRAKDGDLGRVRQALPDLWSDPELAAGAEEGFREYVKEASWRPVLVMRGGKPTVIRSGELQSDDELVLPTKPEFKHVLQQYIERLLLDRDFRIQELGTDLTPTSLDYASDSPVALARRQGFEVSYDLQMNYYTMEPKLLSPVIVKGAPPVLVLKVSIKA